MYICDSCRTEFAGRPKKCPFCRTPIDYKFIAKSESKERQTLTDILASYDNVVCFDTETTGLHFATDRIIELSSVQLSNDKSAKRELDMLIKLPPTQSIPPEIVALTNITDTMLSDLGISEEEATDAFISLIPGERNLLIAHNAQFDMNYLYRMLLRQGKADVLRTCDMLDTLTVYRDRHPYPHKLCNAIELYGLEDKVQNSHRAIDDTLALAEVLKAMDDEECDLGGYINVFGYSPKYGVSGSRISSVTYVEQPYNPKIKLYYKKEG